MVDGSQASLILDPQNLTKTLHTPVSHQGGWGLSREADHRKAENSRSIVTLPSPRLSFSCDYVTWTLTCKILRDVLTSFCLNLTPLLPPLLRPALAARGSAPPRAPDPTRARRDRASEPAFPSPSWARSSRRLPHPAERGRPLPPRAIVRSGPAGASGTRARRRERPLRPVAAAATAGPFTGRPAQT